MMLWIRKGLPGLLSACLIVLSGSSPQAETIHLRTGRTLKGEIVGERPDRIRVRIDEGKARIWILRDQIERIEPDAEGGEGPLPETETLSGESPVIRALVPGEKKGETPATGSGDSLRVGGADGGTPADLLPLEKEEEARGDRLGRVSKVTGNPTVLRANGTQEELKEGDPIRRGDQVNTRDGKVQVLISSPDGATHDVRFSENTSFRATDDGKPVIDLYNGKVWSQIRSAARKEEIQLKIKAPNAVAAVRGDSLIRFEISPEKVAKIALFEGRAELRDRGEARIQDLLLNKMAIFSPEGTLASWQKVDPAEREEFDEWDEIFDDVVGMGYTHGGAVGGGLVDAQAQAIKEEGRLYKEMMDETHRLMQENKAADELDRVGEAIKRYFADMGRFPPEEKAFERLKYDLGEAGWKGPYLEMGVMLPIRDRWGTEILYKLRTSASGKGYVELYSCGPNRKFEEDRGGDDVKVLVAPPRGTAAVVVRPVAEAKEEAVSEAAVMAPPPRATQGAVFIGGDGNEYHRAGCRALGEGRWPISVTDAQARGYQPCRYCNPPR